MTISLQSSLPPGYVPPGVDSKELDPATQKAIATTGITLGDALKSIGLDLTDVQETRFDSVLKSMLPAPDPEKMSSGKLLANLDSGTVQVDLYSIMAVFQQCAQKIREGARELRDSEVSAQVSASRGAAQEIRNAAEDRFNASVTQGAMQIAGGAVSVGMGVAGGAYSLKGINAGVDTTAGARLNAIGSTLASSAQGAGSMLSGSGTVGAAFAEQQAAEHDAAKADIEADVTVHAQNVQQANDLMQQTLDMIRAAHDNFSSVEQSRADSVRGILRNV